MLDGFAESFQRCPGFTPGKRRTRTSGIHRKSWPGTCTVWRLERSRSAADASREVNGAVIA